MANTKAIQTLTALEVDAITGKETVRPLNVDELQAIAENITQSTKTEAEATARKDARASALAKLAKLGLTKAEIASL